MTVTTAQVSKAAHSAYTETEVQDETGRVRQLAVRRGHNHDVARAAADLGRAWERTRVATCRAVGPSMQYSGADFIPQECCRVYSALK